MNEFKKKNKKLNKLRGIFFQIGLIVAGGLTLVAFEWTSPIYITDLPDPTDLFEDPIENPVILPEKEVIKPKLKFEKAPKPSETFVAVEKFIEPIDPTPDPDPVFVEFTPDPEPTSDPEEEFIIVEQMPEFVGGEKARLQFLRDNLNYPNVDRIGKVQGTVYLKFTVNKKGEIKKVTILKGVSPSIDREAIRVVKAMPNWSPGKQRGKKVNVSYNFNIKFKLKS